MIVAAVHALMAMYDRVLMLYFFPFPIHSLELKVKGLTRSMMLAIGARGWSLVVQNVQVTS